MNAAGGRSGRTVEAWQSVTIHWDHISAFARKVLASMTLKKNVMVSITHQSILNSGENILQISTIMLNILTKQ